MTGTALKHLLLCESTQQTAEHFAGALLNPTDLGEKKQKKKQGGWGGGRYDMIILNFSSVVFRRRLIVPPGEKCDQTPFSCWLSSRGALNVALMR